MRNFDLIALLVLSVFAGVMTVYLAIIDSAFSLISTVLMLFVCVMCLCGAYEEYIELKSEENEEH